MKDEELIKKSELNHDFEEEIKQNTIDIDLESNINKRNVLITKINKNTDHDTLMNN